ncbi:SCO4402 family protein [Saccharopolyspora phatthalungensis]|uniref:Uncharacterized protein n=1 Tax=Saccharopolyspora phatthalungensis TaxID=664693 RepID=A0A840QC43_9PSEU|nr:hypothetical protein [Saccharopolyspora phatthalungensis]MBB5157350.1 hypothetical protein [Saccharopolyspora phatthalungensis]
MEAVEVVESPVEPVRYPSMRAEIVLAVKALSDPDYQQRVWIRRQYPHENFYDDFTQNAHILFDDTCVLPDPETGVGDVLYPDEVGVLRALGEVLDPLINELGNVSDERYLQHPQWAEVLRRSERAYRVLSQNDSASR